MQAEPGLSTVFVLVSSMFAGAIGCTNTIVGQPVPMDAPTETGGSGGSGATPPATGGTSDTGGTAGSGGTSVVASDLPCEVQALLTTYCVTCHAEDPPGFLISYADLARTSTTDSSQSTARQALARMQSTGVDHMPPRGLDQPAGTELDAFRAWVEGGSPPASCGTSTPVPPDPYDTPVVCTSGTRWTGGNEESPRMHPGVACIHCHTSGGEEEGPNFVLAGTVYPTPHEPNDCNGVAAGTGATIVITDADGVEHSLTPNAAGNFYMERPIIPLPYTAKVTYDGRERIMVEAQDDGDCNGCHTEAGANRAPGRIFVP